MFKYIIFIAIFMQQVYALTYRPGLQVGLGYDLNTSKLAISPFEKIKKFTSSENIIKHNITKINNFKHLLKKLNIKCNLNIFKSQKIEKLLSQTNINSYTLSYLIYSSVTKFKTKLQKIQKQKKPYIDSVDIGGEYIALIHIKTKSAHDYKNTKNMLDKKNLTFKNIDQFQKILNRIAKDHSLTYEIILDKKHDFLQARDIKELINNIKEFSSLIKGKEIAYKASTTPPLTDNLATIKYLDALYILNDLTYIRKNQEQFNDKIQINKLENLKNNMLRQKRKYTDINETKLDKILKNINIPTRHNSRMINSPIKLPVLNINKKTIDKKYPMILDDTNITLKYDFNLLIKNNGKVVILNWDKTIKENEEIVHKSLNSKIILDTFIDYKNLKATSINSNSYGSITYKTLFDKYEKRQTIKGYGIIKKAICGYSVIDKIGTFEITCDDIEFNDINIDFEHVE